MRIPVWLGWGLIVLAFFTAALLRRFHHATPESPYVPGAMGSLLFAAIFLLLLITAWEHRRGAVPGDGIRLGSLTPLLLILLGEKWIALVYPSWIERFIDPGLAPDAADARYRAYAGVALILFSCAAAWLSAPTARKTWRRARPARWPIAAAAVALTVIGVYGFLALLSATLGAGFQLRWPAATPVLAWVVGGQALLALAEEVYYRGILMSEVERLAPRMGIRRPAARRWTALAATALLFGLEHVDLSLGWNETARALIFTVSLGLLLGLLVMATGNLHLAAGVHAWINWLLLGTVPYYVNAHDEAALPAGTYIGLSLILAFVLAYALQRRRRRRNAARRRSTSLPGRSG